MSATDFGDPHQVIHIPARDLTGTRQAKLAELDMFLAQLHVVRLALCGQAVRRDGFTGDRDQRRRDRYGLWSWPARRLRRVLHPFPSGTAHKKNGRS
jgi:hypothetical protein